jgi:ParB family chromosome partitioning protein
MPKTTGLAAKFAVASDNIKVQNLETEIEKLTQQLKNQNGLVKIDLSLIDRDENQPRKVFATRSIEQRGRSLELHGQKTPIIVIPQPNGRYKLFDGELRVLGATYINWTQIDAVILPADKVTNEIDTFRGQVIAGIQSQQLHDLDLAEAIVKLAAGDPTLSQLEITIDLPRILNTVLARIKKHKALSQLSDLVYRSRVEIERWITESGLINHQNEAALLQMLLELQLNPKTISNHVFPLLSFPSELKEAIRTHDLDSSKATAIAKLTAERLGVSEDEAVSIRIKLIEKTISQKLSLPLVKVECQRYLNPSESSNTRTSKILKSIDSLDLDGLPEGEIRALQKSLKEKLSQIQQLLKNS